MRSSGVVVCLLLSALASAQPAPTGWVVIPLKDYDSLRAKLSATEPDPTDDALAATLTRIEYDLRLHDSQAAGRATITIDVLRDTWVHVPLPGGLLVREARLQSSGKPATLLNGAAIFSKKGRYVLQLDLAAPVTQTGGEERLTLPASKSGVTKARLNVGRAGMEMKASGGMLTGESGETWQAHGRSQEPLVLSWRRKLEEHREELPLRQRGSLLQWLGLGEDASSVWAEVTLDVLQGTARRVKLQVPAGVTVNQVPGANIADWEVKAGQLEVAFLEPVEKQTKFLVQAEAKLPRDGAFELPLLRLLEMERETGGVAVEVLGAAEIRNRTPQGLERADAAELGPFAAPRQAGSVEGFRYLTGTAARTLKVGVARYTPQAMLTANVEEARIHALLGVDGKVLVRARYAVRNNQRNFLKLTLPAGATLWSAALEGRPVRPGQGPDASLMFPLTKARGGEDAPSFAIEVSYLMKAAAWTDRGRAALKLPVLDLPVSRSGVVLFHPPRYRVTVEPGAFRAAEFTKPEATAFTAAAAPVRAATNTTANYAANVMNQQMLVDGFRARRDTRRVAVTSPGSFPAVGPSLFLAAELTGESREPQIELSFQKVRGDK